LERVKAMQRAASAAADADSYRPELIADDEPRYLRRQKPVEIRRRKFGGKTWPFYRRVLFCSAVALAVFTALYFAVDFLLNGKPMLLVKPGQIEVTGTHMVQPEAVLQLFVRDANRSVIRVPLETRRSQIEQLTWVESASVQRVLPNRLRVDLTERTPIAFLRVGNRLALVDADGVVLNRPDGAEAGDFHFPIVTGVSDDVPRDQREKRMQIYQEFLRDIDMIRGGSSDRVSEVELGNPKDLRVVMTGLSNPSDPQAVLIHFGSGDFTNKFRTLVDNFSQWQASAGRVQSIDLQYARQVVINPEANTVVKR
jgi:cell division protein FtsQ